MKLNIEKNNAVVAFDIRNFSAHRYLLGQVKGGGTLLTKLVTDLLNDAVAVLKQKDKEFRHTKPHFLNHTGDGFVLIIRGRRSSLAALLWISEFRILARSKINNYQRELQMAFPKIGKKLAKLDFGIGAHYGTVVDIAFENFDVRGAGVLGSAINIASRVEQCTKDHFCNVIITGFLQEHALEFITNFKLKLFWKSLGNHRLRGFDRAFTFYNFIPGFHKAWATHASQY